MPKNKLPAQKPGLQTPKLIVIIGPTASGKTALSLKLAKKFSAKGGPASSWKGVEIVSADSRAVYKKLDIGSAKPTKTEQKIAPHHLIDIVGPDEILTLAQYKSLATAKLTDIASRSKIPFLVGGTGLYIYTVIDNWQIPEVPPNKKLRAKLENQSTEKLYAQLMEKDPDAKSFIDRQNKRRIIRALEIITATKKPISAQRKKGQPLFNPLIIGIKKNPLELKKAIFTRTKKMIKAGLVKEVKRIVKKYYSHSTAHSACWPQYSLALRSVALSGIHYKEIIAHLQKKMTLSEAVKLINKNDEKLVRHQMTWFKRDKRIHWVKNCAEAEKLVRKFL